MHIWSPLAWTAYIVLPIPGWGLLDGRPLGLTEACVVGAVWWLWGIRRSLPWGKLFLLLLGAKLALGGSLLAEHGFAARYYGNPNWSPPHERSLDFLKSSATRIDPELKFSQGRSDFPLFFFNDLRFNFYGKNQPKREHLPFSVIWEGYVGLGNERNALLYLRGGGLWAQLVVDGQEVITLGPGQTTAERSIDLPAGWRHLIVKVSVPYGAARTFEAGEIEAHTGQRSPFDAGSVFSSPIAAWRITADRVIRAGSMILDGLLLARLAWWILSILLRFQPSRYFAAAFSAFSRKAPNPGPVRDGRAPGLLAMGWLVALVDAFVVTAPSAGRLAVLTGGDDWLTYEAYARDIVLNGPLMRLGAPPGGGAPFYYQPLYPYFLGVVHFLFGEDFFGALLVQRFLLAVTAWSIWRVTTMLLGRSTGLVGLVVGGIFLYATVAPLAQSLLGEALFVPLVIVWTQLLIGLATREMSRGAVIWTGVVGGFATLTRSSLLLAWVSTIPAVLWARRQHHRSVWPVVLLVISMSCVLALATVRNWVVSHRFVLVTTSFSTNLLSGNIPPPSVNLSQAQRRLVYDWLHLDSGTRKVVEYAVQAPGTFLGNLGKKALYTAGCFQVLTGSGGCYPRYLSIWFLAFIGAIFLFYPRHTESRGGAERLLPGLVSLSHLVTVVLIFPNIYGDRLILPLYVLLMPYVALGAVSALRPVWPLLSNRVLFWFKPSRTAPAGGKRRRKGRK